MGGKVILEVTRGALAGQRFEYDEKTRIFIGRQEDCGIVLPESTISRYHCVLEITPPEVKLQDFYSLNGTYLNGTKIGQRDREQSLETARASDGDELPDEHIIHNGDVLGLGSKCELRCTIEGTEVCANCGAVLPEGISGDKTLPESVAGDKTLAEGEERMRIHYNASGQRICENCWLAAEKERLEKRIAEKKAKEEAEKKAAEEARLAAQKECEKEEAREEERRRQAPRKRTGSVKRRRAKVEAEKSDLRRKHAPGGSSEKAEAERMEAERLAAELAAQIAANKPKQIKCKECEKLFTPTASDNNLCPECLTDRAKVLDAILKQMIGKPTPQTAASPSPVKGYTKEKMLGKGGMGEVWKVQESGSGKYYALKTMLPAVQADANAVKIFLREASVGQVLSHKNVIKTYQSGCTDGTFYILMDLCEGGSVDELMRKRAASSL